jgi:hypothetical protein
VWDEVQWNELKKYRKKLLTCVLIRKMLGFAKGQVDQVEKKPQDAKKIYNAIRLLLEAKRIASGMEPKVWIEGIILSLYWRPMFLL